MSNPLLDLLDAATEARVANPQLRASVLAALRLAHGSGLLRSGRLVTLRHDGEPREIIAHGDGGQGDDADRELVTRCRDGHQPIIVGDISAYPLGKAKRIHGVLVLEGAGADVAHLLADLFLQWCAMAEFVSVEKAELIDENFQLREEIKIQFSEHNIIGVSGSFRRVVEN
nr:hypothetical protein [Planctomycetota bacterium]